MNRSLVFLLLLFLGISTSISYGQFSNINETSPKDKTFDIKLEVDKLDNNQYNLAVSIELENGSYVISPFSEDEVYGHFEIMLQENDNFVLDKNLLESPESVEEFDPILEQPVKFVRAHTTYKQKIKLTSQADFEISGLVEFVLEPSCVPYDVEFTLSYRAGKLDVKKTKIFISKEYKL